MSEEDLAARLRAVERALTDGDTGVGELADAAEVTERLDALESAVAVLRERVDALDATTQSLHGYVGELEHVNERVERRADAAREAVERLDREHATAPWPESSAEDSREAASGNSPELVNSGGGSSRERAHGDVREHATRPANASESGDEPSLLDRVRESL